MKEKVNLNETRPDHDKKSYRLITLKNNLECLLVSDTSLEFVAEDSEEEDATEIDSGSESIESNIFQGHSAVCLTVGAGSFQDPQECQGTAHFLEHMLFMGSKKYPKENDFEVFLSKNGGSSNAYTESEHTVYYFSSVVEALPKALDILANFFIDPLFSTNAIDREINAIENEFSLSKDEFP